MHSDEISSNQSLINAKAVKLILSFNYMFYKLISMKWEYERLVLCIVETMYRISDHRETHKGQMVANGPIVTDLHQRKTHCGQSI